METNRTNIHLLHTKLHRPALPRDHVQRPRLLAQLDQSSGHPAILVSTPAGYGKSTLVSSWIAQGNRPGAWLSLDDRDDNMRQFLTYMVAAVHTIFPAAMRDIQTLIQSSSLPPAAVLAQTLINDLDRIEQEFIVVLDDIHKISGGEPTDILENVLRYPPRSMQMVLIGRRDPLLSIAALRAKGMLTELRMQNLRFSMDETASFINNAMGRAVGDPTITALAQKTEGWVTGLRLGALALRGMASPGVGLRQLKGTTRYVVDYLASEVLEHQTDEFRHLLLVTSILDRFCAPLCTALCDPECAPGGRKIDGSAFLTQAQNENLFLIALDPENRWFRYHHLFQQLLQRQLQQFCTPAEIAALHARASEWFEGQGLVEEALHHALISGEIERAMQIIQRYRHDAVNNDQWYLLERWLSLIPEAAVQQDADLSMARVWVHLIHYRFEAAMTMADHIEALIADIPGREALRGEIAFCRGYSLFFLGDGTRALKFISQALRRIPHSYQEARAQAEIIYALSSQMVGRKAQALDFLNDLLANHDSPQVLRKSRLLITYVFVHVIAGDLGQAMAANRRLWQVVKDGRYAYVWTWCAHMQGLIHLYRGEWEAAVEHLERAVDKRYIHHKRAAVDAIAALMVAYQALGRASDAQATMQVLRAYVEPVNDPSFWSLENSVKARLATLQGRPEAVRGWLEEGSPPPPGAMIWWLDVPSVTRCRALIAEGSPAGLKEAERRLRSCAVENESAHNMIQLIGILALQAVACAKRGRSAEALEIVERAATLAQPGGICLPFLEIGPPMAGLVRQLQQQGKRSDFLNKLLTAFGDAGSRPTPDAPAPQPVFVSPGRPQPPVAPLTHRELDIIELLAKRLQNKEIAEMLSISPITVKSHLRNIYQKLDVTKRREAVERATALGIVPGR